MLEEVTVNCPCCGESITLALDLSVPEQSYVEDCSVCCALILVNYTADDGVLTDLSLDRE